MPPDPFFLAFSAIPLIVLIVVILKRSPFMPTSSQPQDPSCIFCKIAAGFIPCHKIFEDDLLVAFLDIAPIVPGHALVIPKAHYSSLLTTPPEALAAINARLPRLAGALLNAVAAPACHILTNCGPEASQSVPHLHYHIIPRSANDGYRLPWPAKPLDSAAAASLKAAFAGALAHSNVKP